MTGKGHLPLVIFLTSMIVLVVLLCWLGWASPCASQTSQVGVASTNANPTVVRVDPPAAYNDLDVPISITGTGFVVGAGVLLDDTPLEDVSWVSGVALRATVPWGWNPGVYTVTVVNPGGQSGSLPDAFTVTEGIGVWVPVGGVLYGGHVNEIVVSPLTPTTLYAASFDAGMFRSQDGGENWSFVFAGIHVADPVIDPLSPNRIYMDGPWSLYRSDDEGDTWIPLTTTFPVTQTTGRDCWSKIRPYVHPTTGALYAAACGAEGGESGLLKSQNYGQTWVPVMDGLTDTQVTALAFHPTDPMNMYLGTASGHVFRSSDGGTSWTYASTPVGYVGTLAVNPFGAHEVWVAANSHLGDPCDMLKSANSDLTAWMVVEPMAGHEWCDAVHVDFSPAVSGTMFVVARHGYKTADGGNTWALFEPDQSSTQNFALHPTDPDIIYTADGWHGAQKTTDGGVTWQIVNRGLTAVDPEALAIAPGQPDTVYLMAHDIPGVFRATQRDQSWRFFPAERAVAVHSFLVDPFRPARIYLGAYGGVHISDDGGQSWPTFGAIVPPPQYADCRYWPEVLRADPAQPGALLAGTFHWYDNPFISPGSIYRSTDYGEHWVRVDVGQEIGNVNDLAYHPMTSTVVYAAMDKLETGGTGMFRSIDGGLTWQRIGEDVEALDVVLDIDVEPGPPYRVLALTCPGTGLYISEDSGESWTPAVSPLGGVNVEQILFAPSDPPLLYAAAVGGPDGPGLYRSVDFARSWQRVTGVPGQVPVYSLAAVTATGRVILYVGTTGGLGEGDRTQALGTVGTDDALVTATVYRYTTLRLAQRLHLPLVLRGFGAYW
jgi:photosystem II stability/assembly factor-like uncharacterized protein